MGKLFRVRKSGTELRTTLHIEDVEFREGKVLVELGLLTVGKVDDEEVYFFNEPYRVPKFNHIYGSKLKGPNDPYLVDAVQGLLFLNPEPSLFLKRKMAEFIVLHFSATVLVESEVQIGQMARKPVLSYEEVFNMINTILSTLLMDMYTPDTQDYVMYKKDSAIDGKRKRDIKNIVRRNRAVDYFENAIHDATEFLIEEETMLKITHSRIRDTKKITTRQGVVSTQTIKKYMSLRTKRTLDKHNSWAPFKSEVTYEKYNDYLDSCDQSASLEEITFKTNISKSTAVEFRKIRYGE